ncbi:hypothetical protein CVT26_005811 [Gymnopilus dilepis]|uniref:Uncharacterized protein n=1 Tax=Gymnopilus dilepis TaxID=231916 RepID=A0A409WG00_9AGAR|nr:hypothetical protein CVT26_005811 [Gymnopilus dilepis]
MPTGDVRQPTAKRVKKNDEGLVPGWEKRVPHAEDDVNNASAHHNDDDDDESVQGLSDNEGAYEEHAGPAGLSENAKGPAARQSLGVVTPTTSVPGYIPLEKALIRVKHLPLDLRQPFHDRLYAPPYPSYMGPSGRASILKHDRRGEIILKLAEDILTTWRHKIGEVTGHH